MKELKKESKAMNAWMDETEKLVGSLRIDMDPKKASRVQQKIDVSRQPYNLLKLSADLCNLFSYIAKVVVIRCFDRKSPNLECCSANCLNIHLKFEIFSLSSVN